MKGRINRYTTICKKLYFLIFKSQLHNVKALIILRAVRPNAFLPTTRGFISNMFSN